LPTCTDYLNRKGEFERVISIEYVNGYIALDNNESIYIACGTHNNTDLDPGPNTYFLSGDGNFSIIKLDSILEFQWAFRTEVYSWSLPHITLNKEGDIYTAGDFYNTGDFDPGPPRHFLTASSPNDGFIYKLRGDFLSNKQVKGSRTEIKIFPNPTNGEIFLSLNKELLNINVEIFDYTGKMIQKERAIDAKQPISIQSGQGIYFIKVYSNNEIIGVSKIVKTQ